MYRRKDIRAVIVGCPLCHDLHCGLETKQINGTSYPCLSNANIIWIKAIMDPRHYDQSFIRSSWIGMPPQPERPPFYFEASYARYQGPREPDKERAH